MNQLSLYNLKCTQIFSARYPSVISLSLTPYLSLSIPPSLPHLLTPSLNWRRIRWVVVEDATMMMRGAAENMDRATSPGGVAITVKSFARIHGENAHQ